MGSENRTLVLGLSGHIDLRAIRLIQQLRDQGITVVVNPSDGRTDGSIDGRISQGHADERVSLMIRAMEEIRPPHPTKFAINTGEDRRYIYGPDRKGRGGKTKRRGWR